jgi:hypothetical protein
MRVKWWYLSGASVVLFCAGIAVPCWLWAGYFSAPTSIAAVLVAVKARPRVRPTVLTAILLWAVVASFAAAFVFLVGWKGTCLGCTETVRSPKCLHGWW